jgi:hypothetical protein
MGHRDSPMVEGVGFSILFLFKLILCRQVPGLQPKRSKDNKRGSSNLENRTRPDLVNRILDQRARRSTQDQPPHPQLPAAQSSLQERSKGHISQEETDGEQGMDYEEEEDQARRREAEMKQLARQQGDMTHSRSPPHRTPSAAHFQPPVAAERQGASLQERSEGDIGEEEIDGEQGMDCDEEDQAHRLEAEVTNLTIKTNLLHFQPQAAAKRQVSVRILYIDSTHIALVISGGHGLEQRTYHV